MTAEPVVEAHPEQVRGETVMNIVERKIGEGRAGRCGRGAGGRGVLAFAEVRVQIFGLEGPWAPETVLGADADDPAGRREVLAAAERDGGDGSADRRKRRGTVVGSPGNDGARREIRQPIIDRIADARMNESEAARTDIAVERISAVGRRCGSRIGVRTVVLVGGPAVV